MNKFPKDFVFGVATSAYQIEGGWNEGGRTPSVWDMMSQNYDQIKGDGNVACDHYHKYKEDIQMMKEMGIKAYRFSLSWNRLLPKDNEGVNQEGLDYYNDLINDLIANGITPYATLFHFDTPMYLEEKGGWLMRSTVDAFETYAKVCYEAFGDRVKMWMTVNEPYIVANMYAMRSKYSGQGTPIEYALTASHHLNLAHTVATKAYRNCKYGDGQIGIVPNLSMIHGDLPDEKIHFADALYNRFYMEYAFKGTYPQEVLTFIKENDLNIPINPDDVAMFAEVKTDFIGVNNYSRMNLSPDIDFMKFSSDTFALTGVDLEGSNYTDYGWEVYPEGIYEVMVHISKLYDYPNLLVTENGAAYKDLTIKEGMVVDEDRIDYLDAYISQCARAIEDGVQLKGYFIWTLMDNFEWTSGYDIKMGLVHVDFETQVRTIKKSGHWYSALINQHQN